MLGIIFIVGVLVCLALLVVVLLGTISLLGQSVWIVALGALLLASILKGDAQ